MCASPPAMYQSASPMMLNAAPAPRARCAAPAKKSKSSMGKAFKRKPSSSSRSCSLSLEKCQRAEKEAVVDVNEGGPKICSPKDILKLSTSLKMKISNSSEARAVASQGSSDLSPIKSLDSLAFEVNRILQQNNVDFFCDKCNQRIPIGTTRYHCLECWDFDLCQRCNSLKAHNAKHTLRPVVVGRGAASNPEPAKISGTTNDLLDFLSGAGAGAGALPAEPKTPQPQQVDMTIEIARQRLVRFLLAVATWWEVDFFPDASAPKLDLSQQLVQDATRAAGSANDLIPLLKEKFQLVR